MSISFRRFIPLSLVLAVITGSIPASAAESWLGLSSRITPGALNGVLSVIQADRDGSALLAELSALTGKPAADALRGILGICPPGRLGHATSSSMTLVKGRDETEISELGGRAFDAAWLKSRYRSTFDQIIAQSGASEDSLEIHAEGATVRVTARPQAPGVCLGAGHSTAEAAFALIHELVHFVRNPRHHREDRGLLRRIPDSTAYARARMLDPGGEVDAYIAGWGAQIRAGFDVEGLPRVYRSMFSAAGAFSGNREQLATQILDGVGFSASSYRSSSRNEYLNLLVNEINELASKIQQLEYAKLISQSAAFKSRLDGEIAEARRDRTEYSARLDREEGRGAQ